MRLSRRILENKRRIDYDSMMMINSQKKSSNGNGASLFNLSALLDRTRDASHIWPPVHPQQIVLKINMMKSNVKKKKKDVALGQCYLLDGPERYFDYGSTIKFRFRILQIS